MRLFRFVISTFCLSLLFVSACGAQEGNAEVVLKDVFAKHYLIGGALNDNSLNGKDPNAAAIAAKHFNTITAENVMKWMHIHPEPNRYDFEATDRFVDFGTKNKMFIVGHTLVWHWQTPKWVFEDESGQPRTREALLAIMKDHIMTVVGRYKGRVHGWDVVNEALDDDGSLRKTKWLEIIGDDFIEKAFEYAREADPNAELYYNDYSNENSARCAGTVRIVSNLQSKGIKVDGIGIQGHWDMRGVSFEEFEASIQAYAKLGVKVMITELDVSALPSFEAPVGADLARRAEFQEQYNPYTNGLPEDVKVKHVKLYSDIFAFFNKNSDKISRVTLWGIYDGTSWRNNWPMRGRTDYPLLFGRDYQPNAAFFAVVKTAQ